MVEGLNLDNIKLNNMKIELLISFLSLVVAICAFVLPLVINKRYREKDKIDSLDNRLDSIIHIGIEYPYLEDVRFTSKWVEMKDSTDEKEYDRYQQYDNYCNVVFNFLHSVCEHFGYDKIKIENYIDIKNWVRTHESNWRFPISKFENVDGYDEKFRKLIESYLS